jgi:IS5 family transposase
MKAHVRVDAESSLVPSVIGTAANVADVTKAHELLHGRETVAFGDAGYIGVDQRLERKRRVVWHVAMKPGKRRAPRDTAGRVTGSSISRRRCGPS